MLYRGNKDNRIVEEISEKLKYIREMLADRTRRQKVIDEIKKKWFI